MAEEKKIRFKHLELWIIGFVIAVVGAVVAFTYAMVGKEDSPDGVYQIEATQKEGLQGYAQDFEFYYYLDNKDRPMGEKYSELCEIYSDNLSVLYATTHEEKTFEGYTSISALSKNPNTDITFDERTYNILHDAYNKTNNSLNYSVFAEELYILWNSISVAGEYAQETYDPLFNEETQDDIDDLVSYINDRNHVDLIFKENNVINLKVSEEYKTWIDAYTEEPVYVGLNVLKNHYILDVLAKAVEQKGYNKGYFFNKDGTITELSEFGNGIKYQLYTYDPNEIDDRKYLGDINVGTPNVECSFSRFNLNKTSYQTYYIIEKDGVRYFRSQYIDIHTGTNNNAYLSSIVFTNTTSSLEAAFLNNELILCSNANEIRTYLDNNGKTNTIMLSIFNDGSKNVHVTENLYSYISLSSDVDYNLVKF